MAPAHPAQGRAPGHATQTAPEARATPPGEGQLRGVGGKFACTLRLAGPAHEPARGGPRRKDSRSPRTLKRKRAGLLAQADRLRPMGLGRSARGLFAALAYPACRVPPLWPLAPAGVL